jgi:hypothetical protein
MVVAIRLGLKRKFKFLNPFKNPQLMKHVKCLCGEFDTAVKQSYLAVIGFPLRCTLALFNGRL